MLMQKLSKNTSGNVGMLSAIAVLPLFVLAGGSIDYLMASTRVAEIRQAANSAALALSSLNSPIMSREEVHNSGLDREAIERLIQASVPHRDISDFNIVFDIDATENFRQVDLTVSGESETSFLQLIGIESIPFSYQTTAMQQRQTAEVSLVLDISSSMNGSRIEKLREAANEFVINVLAASDDDTTSISIVPFGGTVNVGSHVFNRFAASPTGGDTIVDPTEAEYANLENERADTPFRFTDGNFCLELSSDDFEDPDELFELGSYSQIPTYWAWWDFHSWCPTSGAEAVFVSSDADQLKGVINNMALSDGTGTDHGMLWGYKALSPNWRGQFDSSFTDRPLDYDADRNVKFMVVMSDGGITDQFRPADPSTGDVHGNRSANNSPLDSGGSAVGSRISGNWSEREYLYRRGSTSAAAGFNYDINAPDVTAVDHFLRTCEFARNNGVIIYTIATDISSTHWANLILQDCSDDQTRHFDVDNDDLDQTFAAIAGAISSLRIIG